MTQITNNIQKKPLIDIFLIAFNQTIILIFGVILSYVITKQPTNVLINILPCFIIFILFDTSYNWNKPLLRKLGFAAAALYYFIMALLTYKLFASLFAVVIVSSLIIAFGYAKHNGGKWRAITPSILAIIQTIIISNLLENHINIFLSPLANGEISACNNNILIGSSLFLVVSILSNFIVLAWKKWPLMVIVIALVMATFAIYVFGGNESLVVKIPTIAILVYAFGVIATYLIDHLIKKSHTVELLTHREKKSTTYMMLMSVIQTLILLICCAYKFVLTGEFYYTLAIFIIIVPIVLIYFITILLFNISCNKNNPLITKWLIVAIAIIYIAIGLNYHSIGESIYLLIIASSIMFAFSYTKFNGGGAKNYFWAFTPSLVIAIQTIILFYLTSHYIEQYYQQGYHPSIMDYNWSFYITKSTTIFIIACLITNFIVLILNRWWLWLSLLAITLSMAAYSTHFFWYSEFFIRKVPMVIVSIYVGGIMTTFLIKLLLIKSKPQILKD